VRRRPSKDGPRGGRGPFVTRGDLVEAFARFRRDQMLDHAAALTYFGLLSLFPALLVTVAILGLFGQQALIDETAAALEDAGAPAATVDAVTEALRSSQENRGTAGVALVIGLVVALNGASGSFAAAGRALNVVFRVEEGRGFVRRRVLQLGSTLLVVATVILTLVLVFLGGGLADEVLGAIGLGDTAAAVWKLARWPAAMASAMLVYSLVYYLAPNVQVKRFAFITPGAVLGVLLWLVASAGFFFYVSNFGSYGATYGAFAALVILLIWLWLTNAALLFGAELNAAAGTRRAPEFRPGYDGPPLPVKEAADV
jgi:membrane protein